MNRFLALCSLILGSTMAKDMTDIEVRRALCSPSPIRTRMVWTSAVTIIETDEEATVDH